MVNSTVILSEYQPAYESNPGFWFGGHFLGSFFDMFLCGFMLHQKLHWMAWSGDDRRFFKFIVHWSTFWAAAMTAYTIAWTFNIFVTNFGNYTSAVDLGWQTWCHLMDAAVILSVQAFYLDRAMRLYSNSILVPVLVLPFMFSSFGAVLAGKIVQGTIDNAANWTGTEQGISYCYYTWLGTTVLVDLLLTGFILFGLFRSRTGQTSTDKLVNRLIRVSVEAQLPGTIIAVAFIICQAVPGWLPMAQFFMLWHPKCYVVALLAVLNFRFALRKEMSTLIGSDNHKREDDDGIALRPRALSPNGSLRPPRSYREIIEEQERQQVEGTKQAEAYA
ncbi:hypothetical protein JCM24511_00557 [Saitozyma sp. JCM 24511]|nr:hypothetical protein JCM24511_00557 [Saitozyma sp. JCM 24511]